MVEIMGPVKPIRITCHKIILCSFVKDKSKKICYQEFQMNTFANKFIVFYKS